MHGLPHGAILQQGVSTSALESRRPQTRMQAIEKEERRKEEPKPKQNINIKNVQVPLIIFFLESRIAICVQIHHVKKIK